MSFALAAIVWLSWAALPSRPRRDLHPPAVREGSAGGGASWSFRSQEYWLKNFSHFSWWPQPSRWRAHAWRICLLSILVEMIEDEEHLFGSACSLHQRVGFICSMNILIVNTGNLPFDFYSYFIPVYSNPQSYTQISKATRGCFTSDEVGVRCIWSCTSSCLWAWVYHKTVHTKLYKNTTCLSHVFWALLLLWVK